MKTTTIIGVLILIVIAGGAFWYVHMAPSPASGVAAPSNGAGLNGSPNQGNVGQPDTGTPQQPSAGDGTPVAQNLILGIQPDAKLGNVLSAYNGMTLYTYTNDTPGVSNCAGTCASNWPPYTVKSAADIHVPATIIGSVSTITRTDGSLQVTYNNRPLYFYVRDNKPGDTTGQGVGGVWFVVKP